MVGTIPEDKYYVTVEEVIDWLGLRRYYGGTIPTSVENRIKMYIEFAMGKVDRLTATTWNGRRKICYEWHDITKYKGGWWCVPEGTEILTQEGWKPVEALKVGEKVVGYDMRHDRLVDAEITAYLINDSYTGRIVRFDVDGEWFIVSDTHPIFVKKEDKGMLIPPTQIPEGWLIPTLDGEYVVRRDKMVVEDVKGIKMYSFTVEPGHAFVARQNGRVLILGNFGVGVPIFLTKMDLDPNIGKDGVLVLEVFNGVQYDNWAEKFEPRRMTGYWWVDPQEGIVYINTFVFWQGGKEIRVKYVYGRDDLPNTIKELTLLYVARDLLATERFAITVPTGGQTLDFGGMINYIDKRIRELENLHMAIHIATMGKVKEEVEYDPETGEIITVGKDTSN